MNTKLAKQCMNMKRLKEEKTRNDEKHQQCLSSTTCKTKNLHSELCSRTLLAQLGPVYVLLYFYIKKTLGVKGVIQCVGWVVAASPNSLCVRGRDLIPLNKDLNTNLLGRLKTLKLENIKFVDIFGSPNTDCAGFFFIVVQRSMTLTPPLCHSH